MIAALAVTPTCACSDSEPDADLSRIPEQQRPAFEDGEVTFEEYRAAMEGVIECVRDAGFTIDGPFVEPDSPQFLYFETTADPGAENDATTQAVATCEAAHLREISLAWAAVNADPDAEANDRALYQAVLDCLEVASGDDLADVDPGSPQDMSRMIARYGGVYDSCFNEAAGLDTPPDG